MNPMLDRIKQMGIIPVVVLENEKNSLPLAKALIEGGLPCAGVTFRTKAAAKSIALMTQEYPDMLVGAGTVLNIKQVDEAVAAGAKFIVSPGFNPKVVDYCNKNDIPMLPGCITPSEVEQAIEHGLKAVKFFPAEAAGGLAMIKAMSAPYTNMMFMPTGGINIDNVKEYLAFSKILACGGSWMVKEDLIEKQDFDTIKRLTEEAVSIVKQFR